MIRELSIEALDRRFEQGVQDLLVITSVPAGAEALIGTLLKGATLTVAGAYTCTFDVGGISKLEAHLTCTVTGTAPTTSGGTTFQDQSTIKQPFTGVGLMVTATRQDLAVASLIGERTANLIITLPAASTAAFTLAEFNGK